MENTDSITPSEKNLISNHEQAIFESLELNTTLAECKPETRILISQTISQTLLNSSKLLDIPFVQVSLMTIDEEHSNPNTNAWMTKYRSNGENAYIISFSPTKLKKRANLIQNETDIGEIIRQELILTTAHENYHVREATLFPQRFAKTSENYSCKSELNNPNHHPELDWGELAADMFAIKFLQSIPISLDDLESAVEFMLSRKVAVAEAKKSLAEKLGLKRELDI